MLEQFKRINISKVRLFNGFLRLSILTSILTFFWVFIIVSPKYTSIELPMWKGDRYFLPLVFDGDPRVFHGYMPYKDGDPLNWTFIRQ
jgi:hypothetical protein